MEIRRIDPRGGYDRWAETYDATPNPVVAFDERITPALIGPHAGERILDAGRGTGRHIHRLLAARAAVTGMDFSEGMLAVAAERYPDVDFVRGDLQDRWPFADGAFDAVLCALVGEHLEDIDAVASEMRRVIRPGGRAVFGVYHPEISAAGKEAHFRRGHVEYRLGAVRHELTDYRTASEGAGFADIAHTEHEGTRRWWRSRPTGSAIAGSRCW